MRHPFFFCLAVLLPACGAPEDDGVIDVTYDACTAQVELESPTAEETTRADEGLALWNERASLTLARSSALGAPRIPVRFDEAADAFHGVYDDEHGIVYINRGLTGHALAITIAHELGHAFGLVHVSPSTRKSLMNPSNLEIEPTEKDAEQVHALWGTCAP